MKLRTLLLSIIAVGLMYACDSTEKESKKYETNKLKVESLKKRYPLAVDTLNIDLEHAEKLMKEAMSITDEKKQIEKMKQANSIISLSEASFKLVKIQFGTPRPTRILLKYEENIEETEEISSKIRQEFDEDNFGEKTIYMLEEAEEYIAKAELVGAEEYYSVKDMIMNFHQINKKLDVLNNDLSTYYSNTKSKMDEIRKAERAAEKAEYEAEKKQKQEEASVNSASENKTSTTKVEKSSTIKCKKCGTKNDNKRTKCKSCGAPTK